MSTKKNLTKEEIKKTFKLLTSKKDSSGRKITPQQRGFEFEKLIHSVLSNESLEPSIAYNTVGEQIDGSFFWQGQTFLLEAKWTKRSLPASSIYSFKGKVDGKFHTTSGIYLSMNGFSPDAEDALKFGKSLNVLLFDKSDIGLIFNGKASFLEVFKFKLRAAGDHGSLNAPFKLIEKAEEISKIKPSKGTSIFDSDLLVFVEGKRDLLFVHNLFEPLKKIYKVSYKTDVLGGFNNIRNLPTLLSSYAKNESLKGVIVILDNDHSETQSGLIENVSEQLRKSSIPINPLFLKIDKESVNRISSQARSKELKKEITFKNIENYLKLVLVPNDFDEIILQDAIDKILKRLKWNYKDKYIDKNSEFKYDNTIESLKDLIEYINNEVTEAMRDNMPLEWLKENYSNYDDEVREFLQENYARNIIKMGWDLEV